MPSCQAEFKAKTMTAESHKVGDVTQVEECPGATTGLKQTYTTMPLAQSARGQGGDEGEFCWCEGTGPVVAWGIWQKLIGARPQLCQEFCPGQ